MKSPRLRTLTVMRHEHLRGAYTDALVRFDRARARAQGIGRCLGTDTAPRYLRANAEMAFERCRIVKLERLVKLALAQAEGGKAFPHTRTARPRWAPKKGS